MNAVAKASEPKWCLMVHPESTTSNPKILALTNDVIEAARQRGWLLLGNDADVVQTKTSEDDNA